MHVRMCFQKYNGQLQVVHYRTWASILHPLKP